MGFANVIVFAVVYVNYDWKHAIIILPLLPILTVFKLYCWKFLDPVFDYYIPSKQDDPESPPVAVHRDTQRDKLRNRFGHPAWTKPLITPMVHAKATHLLPSVYHGRMHYGDQDYSNQYGQNGGGIGKVEVVSEQDLDYEHFRVYSLNLTKLMLRTARNSIQQVLWTVQPSSLATMYPCSPFHIKILDLKRHLKSLSTLDCQYILPEANPLFDQHHL